MSLFLRFYCRYLVPRTWGSDDSIAVAILFFSFAQQGVLQMFLYWGCGLHMELLDDDHQLEVVQWMFIEEVLYYSVHWVIKSAFLWFYLRVSRDHKIMRYAVVLTFLQCIPFDEILHPGTHPDAKCINKLILLIAPCASNILVDLYLLMLSISTICNLKASKRKKLAGLRVTAFGSISVIIACLRIPQLLALASSTDKSWVMGEMIIVASLEIQFAIIAVNLPSLKILWIRYIGCSDPPPIDRNATMKRKRYRLSTIGEDDDASAATDEAERGTQYSKRTTITQSSKRTTAMRFSYWERDLTSIASEEESTIADMAVVMPLQWVKKDVQTIRVGRGHLVRSMMSMERVEDIFPVGHFLRTYGPRRNAESVVPSLFAGSG
ncbi:integral membrane protein [Stemphylium lycopersici]|nr:integral membrane protein [Stemphylium lycopersici]